MAERAVGVSGGRVEPRVLAAALRAAEADGDDLEVAYLIGEVCDYLDLPLDETELGLTDWAADQVEAFLSEHAPVCDG